VDRFWDSYPLPLERLTHVKDTASTGNKKKKKLSFYTPCPRHKVKNCPDSFRGQLVRTRTSHTSFQTLLEHTSLCLLSVGLSLKNRLMVAPPKSYQDQIINYADRKKKPVVPIIIFNI
jgi:hypothetical protein